MAKKQTRRSISVSRSTYERLKAFCEANNVSMSQLVETRVNDFLGTEGTADTVRPAAPRPQIPSGGPSMSSSFSPNPSPSPGPSPGPSPSPSPIPIPSSVVRPSVPMAPVKPPIEARPAAQAPVAQVPMTSAAARIAVEPPPPIIKPKQETAAPKPAEKRPDQIFTF
jgi:hypothetical protein